MIAVRRLLQVLWCLLNCNYSRCEGCFERIVFHSAVMKHVGGGGGGEIRAQSRAEHFPVFPSSGFPHSDSESLRAGGPRRRVARHRPQAQGTAVSVCHILALCSETAVAINKQC